MKLTRFKQFKKNSLKVFNTIGHSRGSFQLDNTLFNHVNKGVSISVYAQIDEPFLDQLWETFDQFKLALPWYAYNQIQTI